MNAVEAAKAYVSTYFENGPIAKGVASAKRNLQDLAGSARDVGTKALAMAAPLLGIGSAAAVSFAGVAGELTDLSQITGIGTESLSEMSYAATRLGSDMESLKGALGKQTKFLGDLNSGSKAAHATLGQLGLSVEDLAGLSPDQTFGLFSDAIASVDDQTEKTALTVKLFGESGTALLPMLNEGSAGMAAMRQEARDLGIAMGGDAIAAGDALSDALDQLQAQAGAVTNGIGAALAPALAELLITTQPLIASVIGWITENNELIVQIAAVAAGAAGVGAVLVTAGFAVSGLIAFVAGAVTVAGAFVTVLGAILSPIGLVTAAVGGMVYYLTDLSGAWDSLSASVGESMSLAATLVSNGELELAVELVWAQVQVLWAQGVGAVVELTGGMVTKVIGVLARGIDALGTMLDKTRDRLAGLIAATGEFVGLFPEGTTDELNQMQAAGQVGKSALHGLAEGLKESADGFQSLGGNVDELKAKLAGIKRESVEANIKADIARAEKRTAPKPEPKKDDRPRPILAGAGSALSGTFSSVASRQLFSGGGNVVETELKTISRNTAETAKQVARNAKVGS